MTAKELKNEIEYLLDYADENKKKNVSKLLEIAEEDELKEILLSLQGLRKFQVLPRILATPYSEYHPEVYSQNDYGLYQKVEITEKIPKEAKRPNFELQKFEGKNYLTQYYPKKGATRYSVEVSNDKKLPFGKRFKSLFITPLKTRLLLVVDGNFIIESSPRGIIILELLELTPAGAGILQKKKFDKQGKFFALSTNQVIFITDEGEFTTFKYDNYSLQGEVDDKYHSLGIFERKTSLWYAIVLNPREIVISLNGDIHIFEDFNPVHLIRREYRKGILTKISEDRFLVQSEENTCVFKKGNDDWVLSQFLIRNKERERFFLLPPGKSELLKMANLIPVNLPRDLKILVTEFCTAS